MIVTRCNKEFKKPISIAFEKVVDNMILITGKNYVFRKTEVGKKGKPEAKGIKAMKRSGAPICNIPAKNALNRLVMSGFLFPSLIYLREKRHQLINRKLHIINFIQRSKMSKDEKAYGSNAPVLKVVSQIKREDPNMVPEAGDYVTFAITEHDTRRHLSAGVLHDET